MKKVANHFLDIIDMESERLASLIEDILLLSEIESKQECERQTCDVNQIITEVVELLQKNSKEKPVTIQYVPKQNLPLYLANPNRIKQLVINLLDNAIKYTEEGCVEVVCEKQEDDLVLIVSDTGIGMEQEHLERIFERFYRVDKGRSRKMGGTGLGLSIVKHIIERYRGSVKVESRLNVGTKFTVRLPYEG